MTSARRTVVRGERMIARHDQHQFTTSTIALAIGLYANAAYSTTALRTSTLMLLPAVVGMYGGQWIRHALSPGVFRTCLLVSLLMLGAHMLVR